jgi:PAS domain S-box-containing protein
MTNDDHRLRGGGAEVPAEAMAPASSVAIIANPEKETDSQLFQYLIQEARDYGIFMLDPEGNVASWNDGAARIKGYSAREIIGQHFSRFYTPEAISAGRPAAELQSARKEGKFEEEGWRIRRDGSRFLANVIIRPLCDEAGNLVGFSKIVRDITERRNFTERLIESEDRLRRLAAAMEDRVTERTLELQLSLAEKTVLFKEVHHRVKNNLQVICSLLSMQMSCLGSDSSAEPLNAAYSRVLAMSLVHEQIYQSDRVTYIDFGRYIETLGHRLFAAYCIDPSRITLQQSVAGVHLSGTDAVPCGLILNELMSNSLKHAFPGHRKGLIRVSFRRTDREHVELVVADNGIGLPPDFRLTDNRTLGMQVVQSLVHQLRANLVFAIHGGATFRLSWKTTGCSSLT